MTYVPYHKELKQLPDPSETWKFSEMDINKGHLFKMDRNGLIETVERGDKAKTWRTTDKFEKELKSACEYWNDVDYEDLRGE